MSKLKVIVLYDRVLVDDDEEAAPAGEKSPVVRTLDKKEVEDEVLEALAKLGHEPVLHELDGTPKSLLALARMECDLVFNARTACVEEGRTTLHDGARAIMDSTRFAQFGRWEGEIRYAGKTLRIDRARVFGTKDRSWGVRPVGEPESGGAPPTTLPSVYFLWGPIHWKQRCTHFATFEDPRGLAWHQDAAIVPAYESPEAIPGVEDPGVRYLPRNEHKLVYQPGTRRMKSGELALVEHTGERHVIQIEPLIRFQMKGIGYMHPEWGHGFWKGESALGAVSLKLAELDPLAPQHQYIQQVVRARIGEREGVGLLEQLCIGTYPRYGFNDLLGGAS